MSLNPTNSAVPFRANYPTGMEPTPLQVSAKTIWNIVSVILFPIGLIRLGYCALQSLGSRIVHPANFSTPSHLVGLRALMTQHGGEEVSLTTPDGKTLNAMLFRGHGNNRSGIVKAFGNNVHYEMAGIEYLNFVRQYVGYDVDVLMINYRGCGKSEGKSSPAGLALDTYTAGEYLFQQEGTDASRILFDGHSLGGYAAAAGAGLFQRQHPEARVSALNNRSMHSLTYTARQIMGSFAAWLVSFLDWELNAQQAWEQLKGHKIVVYSQHDVLSSFRHYVNNSPRANEVRQIEMQHPLDSTSIGDPHNRAFTHEESLEIGDAMRNALARTALPVAMAIPA